MVIHFIRNYSIINCISSFYISFYIILLLLFSSFFFKFIINLNEIIIAYDSCYSLYHIHFFSLVFIVLFYLLLFNLIAMIIDRVLLFKFFLCYECSFIIIIFIILLFSCNLLAVIIIIYFIWNSMFEILLGLNSLFL